MRSYRAELTQDVMIEQESHLSADCSEPVHVYSLTCCSPIKGGQPDLNRQQPESQSGTLPIELWPPYHQRLTVCQTPSIFFWHFPVKRHSRYAISPSPFFHVLHLRRLNKQAVMIFKVFPIPLWTSRVQSQ